MPDAVKSPLLLPPYLLALFLLFLLAFSLLAMLADWLPRSSEAPAEQAGRVLQRGAAYAESCLAAALLPAALFTAIRVARNPVSRPLSLLLPSATMFLILLLGPAGLALLGSRDAPALPAVPPSGYLSPGAFVEAESPDGRPSLLLVSRLEAGGTRLEDVVLLREAPASSRFSWYAGGTATATEDGTLVRLGRNVVERIGGAPIWTELTRPGEPGAGLLEDLGSLGEELRRAEREAELDSILLCAALASFLCFSAVLLRMTRWPLFGIALLVVLWRFCLAGLRLAGEVVRPTLGSILPASASFLTRNLPALLLLAAALVALAVDLVFVSFDYWERELGL